MIGNVLNNYRILEKIGEGGMGTVYTAHDTSLHRDVALKIISPELARKPGLIDRFKVEAIAQAKLNHPNIVTIHAFTQKEDVYYIVMELVQGSTLREVIRQQPKASLPQILNIFSQVLSGIAYAHTQGVIHRDIKPSNIFFDKYQTVKIGDFGIAKVEGFDGLTATGTTMGSPLYSSPEQLLGKKTDGRTDIYSLGMLLYEMLTGATPVNLDGKYGYEALKEALDFLPRSPMEMDPSIPQPISDLVMKCIDKDVDQRFTDVSAIAREVDRFIETITPVPGAPRTFPDPERTVELTGSGIEKEKESESATIELPSSKTQPVIKPPVSKQKIAIISALAAVLVLVVTFLIITGTSTPPTATPTAVPSDTVPDKTVPGKPAVRGENGAPASQMPGITHPGPSSQPEKITPPKTGRKLVEKPKPSPSGDKGTAAVKNAAKDTAALPSSTVSRQEIQETVDQMNTLIRGKKFQEAIDLGKDAIDSSVVSGRIYLTVAQAYFYNGSETQAAINYNKALELDGYVAFYLRYVVKKGDPVFGTLMVSGENLSFTPDDSGQQGPSFSIALARIKDIDYNFGAEITRFLKKKKNRKKRVLIIKTKDKKRYELQLTTRDGKMRSFVKFIIESLMKK